MYFVEGNVWDVMSFYQVNILRKHLIFWYIMGQLGTFSKKSLVTIVLLLRFRSIKLHLVNIEMIMVFIILTLVDDFLLNVKNRIKRSDSDFTIRCVFSLESIQLCPFENEEPIASSWYCSTEPHEICSFNDYIYFSLMEGILMGVINEVLGIFIVSYI